MNLFSFLQLCSNFKTLLSNENPYLFDNLHKFEMKVCQLASTNKSGNYDTKKWAERSAFLLLPTNQAVMVQRNEQTVCKSVAKFKPNWQFSITEENRLAWSKIFDKHKWNEMKKKKKTARIKFKDYNESFLGWKTKDFIRIDDHNQFGFQIYIQCKDG